MYIDLHWLATDMQIHISWAGIMGIPTPCGPMLAGPTGEPDLGADPCELGRNARANVSWAGMKIPLHVNWAKRNPAHVSWAGTGYKRIERPMTAWAVRETDVY